MAVGEGFLQLAQDLLAGQALELPNPGRVLVLFGPGLVQVAGVEVVDELGDRLREPVLVASEVRRNISGGPIAEQDAPDVVGVEPA